MKILRRIAVVAICVLVASAALLEAQTTGVNDQEVQRFVLPGGNQTGLRVHASRSHMSLTLPIGKIAALGGYKVAFAYAHGDNTKPSVSAAAMPISGTPKPLVSGSGIPYQRAPYAGSVIGIAVGASTALTAGTVTAEATIRQIDGTVIGTGLTAVLSSAAAVQYNATSQPRELDNFTASDGVGCRLTSSSDLAPVTAQIVCTVTVEQ